MSNPESETLPAAVVYAHSLLGGSMTFIKSHAERLERHVPVYAGSHRVPGLALPDDRSYTVNEGGGLGSVRELMFREFGYAPGLVRRLRKHGPRVLHAHFGTSGPSALALANALRVPLVVTFHGKDATMTDEEARSSRRGRSLLRHKEQLIEGASVFIAVSNYVRDRLLERGYPEDKVVLHRNGIDLESFRPPAGIMREPLIVFVGRFVEKKGATYLIDAAARLREQGRQFRLVMIGDGPLQAALSRQAAARNVPCEFTGFLQSHEVADWVSRATVVAVPSVVAANGDSEGLPTILLEAQALETPIVATRHSGIPEGLRDGQTGELVDERDTTALAASLGSFLADPDKARKFGQAARRFVAESFDLRTQVRGLEDIYLDVERSRYAR